MKRLIWVSPVPRHPRPRLVIMSTNPCPVAVWRGAGIGWRRMGSTVIGGWRRRGTTVIGGWWWKGSTVIVRSTVGTKRSSCNSCCCSNNGGGHSERKEKRVAATAVLGIRRRGRNNHKKSQADGRQNEDLSRGHFCLLMCRAQ